MNRIKATVLRRAKSYIKNRSQEFVCIAVKEAAADIGFPEAGDQLIACIEAAIHPHATVSTWLIHGGAGARNSEIFVDQNNDGTWPRLVEYRCRWIDDMIATLEAGGEL